MLPTVTAPMAEPLAAKPPISTILAKAPTPLAIKKGGMAILAEANAPPQVEVCLTKLSIKFIVFHISPWLDKNMGQNANQTNRPIFFHYLCYDLAFFTIVMTSSLVAKSHGREPSVSPISTACCTWAVRVAGWFASCCLYFSIYLTH